jgi:iron complex outermembrane receptor protein
MKKTSLAGAISLVVATASGAVSAASIIEEVIVTAQKREQAITDVALTVTAVSGDVARAMGVQDTRDVAMLATNIDIKGAGMADANPAVTVRGIGMNNFNANNNPSVGVYLDEVFLASPAMINLSMMDVGRIEVLKGPQGTLYGRNATGGALNIISAKPTQEVSGFASLTVGDYDKAKFEGAVGGGLSDTLSGRVSVLYDNQDENFHEYHAPDGSDQNFRESETSAIRVQLAGEYDRLSWNLGASYLDQDIGNSPFTSLGGYWNSPDEVFVTPCQGELANCVNTLGLNVADRDGDEFTHDFQVSRVGEMRIQSDVSSVTAKIEYEFDKVSLTSITAWAQQDRDFGENIWSTPLEAFAVVHDEEMEQFSQELRLSGETDRSRWMVGAFYWDDTFESTNVANSADILGLLAGVTPVFWDNDQETEAYAVFASVDWDLGERWMLTTGLRYSNETTDFKGGTQGTIVDPAAFDDFVGADLDLPVGITIPFTETDDDIDEDNTSYRVALEFRPNDDWLTYGSVTTGFKSGGFFGDFTFDNSELEPFDSETVTAYELGAKATLADGLVQLNGAVFYYDYEDIQTFVPSAIGFKLDNLEEAAIAGAEIELLTTPIDGLDIRLGASYLDTEVDSDFVEFDGNELPNSPETQFTGTIRYEFPVGEGMAISLQADGKYSDEMFRESTNNPWLKTDSYSVLNLRGSLLSTDGTWEVAVWGRNIADEEYEQERFASDIIGQVVGLQGNPRTYGATLNYNF